MLLPISGPKLWDLVTHRLAKHETPSAGQLSNTNCGVPGVSEASGLAKQAVAALALVLASRKLDSGSYGESRIR